MNRPLIIAVDYDGTLYRNSKLNRDLIARLIYEQRKGNVIILWTCREGKSLDDAILNLRKGGFKPNYVNTNCPAGISMLGRNARKVFADIYIDDKNAAKMP